MNFEKTNLKKKEVMNITQPIFGKTFGVRVRPTVYWYTLYTIWVSIFQLNL